ncbi:MAG: hypothetical protein ACK2T6_05780 [Anaerolineae bacterium]
MSALEMQRTAFVQLTSAVLLFFVIVMVAAYVFMVQVGRRDVRGVAPVLGGFMEAGRDSNVVAGHSLLSSRGLADMSREDLAALYADRHLFAGYDRLRLTSFSSAPSDDPFVSETATVAAIVEYDDGLPARLDAQLDLEDTTWRIQSISIARAPR